MEGNHFEESVSGFFQVETVTLLGVLGNQFDGDFTGFRVPVNTTAVVVLVRNLFREAFFV